MPGYCVQRFVVAGIFLMSVISITGCTVKAVGDPKRPITINAHITLDIKGLEKTATNIEDYVSGEAPTTQTNKGGTL